MFFTWHLMAHGLGRCRSLRNVGRRLKRPGAPLGSLTSKAGGLVTPLDHELDVKNPAEHDSKPPMKYPWATGTRTPGLVVVQMRPPVRRKGLGVSG